MTLPESYVARLPESQRYRLLVEAVTDYAIYLLDPDGFIVSWNPGAQRAKGYAEVEIVGRHFSTFYTEEDRRQGLPARALATAARAGRFESEGWRVRRDGSRFWAHVVVDPVFARSGDLVGYAKVTRDLTERRQAEEQLRRSEEQFRLLVQSVTDYALYMLDEQGVITSWNAGAQRIKGYVAADVIGSSFSRFYTPEDQARGLPATALQTAAAQGRFEGEGWRVRKDGSTFWANAIIDAIHREDGTLVGFAKITRDMTDKRQAQQSLEAARERLFEAQKVEALGRLTGGVAHDFNNLLMVMLSSLELLRRSVPPAPKIDQLLDSATKAAQRGAALTQRLLAFARRQELAPRPLDLHELVHSMKALLNQSVGPTVRITVDVPSGLPPVLADVNQLELALLNLVVNANDAMPEGGMLSLNAAETKVEDGHRELSSGRYLCVSVADSGIGMDAQTLARATEPFFTTKGAHKGTGLGLAMVHGLAAQSRGCFTLRSVLGKGTTATMWLPVAEASATASTSDGKAHAPVSTLPSRRTVLLVDDDDLVLATTSAMLEDLGQRVLNASSAQDALNLLRDHPEVAMVIADYGMPDISGVDMLTMVRKEHGEHLPFVLVTGYAENIPPASGNFMHLRKPFTLEALAQILDQWSPRLAQPAPSADFVRTSSGSGLTTPKPGDES